jgi:geranylgeranyl reductase family protein
MGASTPTVAIVGAGPAGAAAAHVVASRGVRAVLLERARHPREKVCGEGCTPRAVRNLDRMGLLGELATQGAAVSRAFLVSPGGVELLAELPASIYGGRGLVIPRASLDARLVERAVAAGAELREGVKVGRLEVRDDGVRVHAQGHGVLNADLVLGCDGMPSVVRKCVGAPAFAPVQIAQAMRGIFANVRLPYPDALAILWDRSVLPAYGWVFPLPGGRANVGIGLRVDQLRAGPSNLRELFERFLKLPQVREALRGARLEGRAQGHPLPLTSRPGRCVFERALLAGDAAGFVNPLTGEGIEYALESGELAGAFAVQAAERGDFGLRSLQGYARACNTQFGNVLRLNGWMRLAFAVPWLLDRIFRAGMRSAAVRDDVARISLGGVGARITPRLVWGALTG